MNVIRSTGLIGAMAGMVIASHAFAQSADEAASVDRAAIIRVSSTSDADRELSRSVRRALSRTPGLVVSGIHVQARDGAVQLTGNVPRRAQIQQAGDVTKAVPGVTSVSNRLTLRTRGGNVT